MQESLESGTSGVALYRCTLCREMLPRDAYGYRGLNARKGLREGADYYCKACRSAYHAERMSDPERRRRAAEAKRRSKERNPDGVWASYIAKTFGITADDYYRMLEEQGGVCAICGSDEPRGRSKVKFSIDHCHTTGKVRGLLCGPCNTGIGHLKDDVTVLAAAIDYLEGSRG